jgi:alkanesulfonate monooxygenase SsuD/methylene tetrahydromethanopterin reductase-like flavin-dependent oxidoreductase (luciferase family)
MTAAPSYAAAVAREGGIPMVAGSEDQVTEELEILAAAGVTDFVATRVARRRSDDEARTRSLLTALARS